MIPNVFSCSQLRGSYGADTWLGFMAQVYVLRAQQKLGSSLFFEILISSVEKRANGQMLICIVHLCSYRLESCPTKHCLWLPNRKSLRLNIGECLTSIGSCFLASSGFWNS